MKLFVAVLVIVLNLFFPWSIHAQEVKDDSRWGTIDRNGIVHCSAELKGLKCRSEQTCTRHVDRPMKQYCLTEEMERPYTGKYVANWSQGEYTCACCNASLFRSEDKFDAKDGYATFSVASGNVGYKHHEGSWWYHPEDTGLHCEVCGAHLGNVREDGPWPLGRYETAGACSSHVLPLRAVAPSLERLWHR